MTSNIFLLILLMPHKWTSPGSYISASITVQMVQITVVFDNKQTTLLNLIIVVVAMEKRFLFEYHACEHAAQTP